VTAPSVVVVGGGAAGFFAAIAAAEVGASVVLLERGREVLAKVRISGGGRCNVTHACFEPKRLVQHYPRGGRELLGPFHHFQPRDTMDWFLKRGVDLKIESDGRVFPSSNQSQSIVDALMSAARAAGVRIHTGLGDLHVKKEENHFRVHQGENLWQGDRLILATGSGAQGHRWAHELGHSIVSPVPSLFTLTISDPRIKGLAGVSVKYADLSIEGTELKQSGALLITHWGLSGPVVLKLSAWGARELNEREYKAHVCVNWVGRRGELVQEEMKGMRTDFPRGAVSVRPLGDLPHRLWERLVSAAGLVRDRRWADLTKTESVRLGDELTRGRFLVSGKSAFKEEFVTAGGVRLKEINFSTMESRLCSKLYFAGELLDIDGVTGGFNFQSAWTTGWLAGRAAGGGR
jgi:predicted Rossmann fold flavoprotein